MKTIAVIAELNPAHNGHAWLFEHARRLSGADHLVVLLSGDFVQRGEPAVYDKYLRTRMALAMGADLVLELPVSAACGSARRFAEGACSILDGLGFVNELWFGSECGSMEPLLQFSGILSEEPAAYRELLQQNLSGGRSFAASREAALRSCLPGVPESTLAVLHEPNNILGLEYCLALKRLGSSVIPRTLPRRGALHTDPELSADGFSSASSLRNHIISTAPSALQFSDLQDQVPKELHSLYRHILADEPAVSADNFSDMLCYRLWHTRPGHFSRYLDVSEDLGNRIEELRPQFFSFEAFASLLKTKDRSLTHIRRALLHILLDIRNENALPLTGPSVVRLLGRSGQSSSLFSACKEKGRLSLISGGTALNDPQYTADLFASQLYESVRSRRSGTAYQSEFRRSVLMPEQL